MDAEKIYGLGLVDYYLGKFEAARQHFNKAKSLTEDPVLTLSILADLLFVESRTAQLEEGNRVLAEAEKVRAQLDIEPENLHTLERRILLPAVRYFTAREYFYWMDGEQTDFVLLESMENLPLNHPYTQLLVTLTKFRIKVLGAHDLQIIPELTHFIETHIERPVFVAEALNLLGICELFQNRYEKAIAHFNNSLELNLRIGNHYLASLNRANIGSCLRRQGNVNKALEFLIEAEQNERTVGNTRNLPIILENIALCHSMKGEFKEADEYFEKALQVIGTREIPYVSANTLYEIATTKYSVGDSRRALELFQQAYDIAQKQNSPLFIVNSLFYQFLILLELDRTQAHEKLEELNHLTNKLDQISFRKLAELAQAIYLKSTLKIKEMGRAYEILEALSADEKNTSFFIKMTSNLHLLDLMIIEAGLSKDLTTVEPLESQIDKLKALAKQSESALITLELKHVEARYEMMMGNIEKAIRNLEEGIKYAEEIGFTSQKIKLETHKKEIENELLTWIDQVNKSQNRIDLLNQSRLMDYLKSVQKILAAK